MTKHLELPKERNIYLPKQVDQASMNDMSKSILEINEHDEHLKKLYPVYGFEYKPKPIKMYIDSYGGSVYQCMGLIGVMENSTTEIHTIVTGAAMSCGFIILINGHKRYGYKHSTPMYHQISGVIGGKIEDMEQDIVEYKRLQKLFEDMTTDKTSISKKQLKDILKSKKDWFMSAKEAKNLGVIDEII